MTVVKANFNALFSVGLFFLICIASAILLFIGLVKSPDYWLLKFAGAVFLMIIAFLLLARLVRMNKKMILEKGKIIIRHPLIVKEVRMPASALKGWQLEIVKMKSGDFKELRLLLNNKEYVKFSNKEHQNFEKAVSYLRKHAKKLELKN